MTTKTFRLYDTQTRAVRTLTTDEPAHLRFYCCGPTVYSYAHIGNFKTFLAADLVVRTAEAIGWKVTYVSNITDVGHLTSDDQDGGDGQDRMEKGLRSKEGQRFHNVWDLADYYATAFVEDWQKLNLRAPYVRPRATQHMREQILGIQALIASGHAYETPTGVYFDVASFEGYGKLSGNRDRENLQVAVRDVVQDDNKRHPGDFALWKKDDKHLMQWYSPWGWGFPGWHIECSAMSKAYLGDTIDLHGGGEDLIFPHHECEIAQSECMTGKPFCRHFMHVKFLQVDGKRMSKSSGNFFTVRDLLDKGYLPLALRYALISVPYRKDQNFTMQSLRDAQSNVERMREADRVANHAAQTSSVDSTIGEFAEQLDSLFDAALDAMCDDLNTSVALAKALEGGRLIVRSESSLSKTDGKAAQRFLSRVNQLLGIVRSDYDALPATVAATEDRDDEVRKLVEQRAEAKQNKDFSLADSIRADIEAMGYELRDTPEGTTWRLRPMEVEPT